MRVSGVPLRRVARSVADVDPIIAGPNNAGVIVAPASKTQTCRDRKAPVAKAGDVDASAAEAVKSGSAETAAQRSCTETAHPAAEATDCTTAETATTNPAATKPAAMEPAAAEPASMTTGEPTPSVTTTAPSVATATAATPACKGINRSKGECSTDRGGDGNSDDCFSKHGKFPLWNDLPTETT